MQKEFDDAKELDGCKYISSLEGVRLILVDEIP